MFDRENSIGGEISISMNVVLKSYCGFRYDNLLINVVVKTYSGLRYDYFSERSHMVFDLW